MKRICHYKMIGLLLSALTIVSCTSVEKKQDQTSSPPNPILQSEAENQAVPPPSLPPPPPLLPLKPPEGAQELEALVSLSVTEGSLKEVLQALAEQARINLIVDRDVVDENVTVSIRNLPLWQALEALLAAHNLYFAAQPGYIRISRMMTRTFHIDYIRSLRGGMSNTQVSLSSGGGGNAGIGATAGSTGGTSGSGGTTTLGALGGSSSSGDITIQSAEFIDFWGEFDKNIRKIMQDPLYEIIRSEYDQKDLKRELALIPYEEEYEREVLKSKIETFRLQKQMIQKRLEAGVSETGAPAPEISSLETTASETTTQSKGNEGRTGSQTGEEENLVGTYSLDPQTGTLIVTTTPEVMARIESFISRGKEHRTRQVNLDVQILEVSLSKGKKLGVDWSGFPGLIQYYRMPHLASLIGSQLSSSTGGGGSGTSTSGQGIASPLSTSTFPTSPDGSVQVGVLSPIGSHQALQYSFNNVVSFLKEFGEVNAVSRPQITTLNNQPAVVSVGVNDFYITFEQQTTSAQAGLATSQVTSRLNPIFIGVTLQITPQISPDGQVIMKIVPAINKKVGEKTVPTGIPSSPTQKIPLLETRQTSTLVKSKTGETIIISGLIQESREEANKNVPFFEDIPWAGKLFRHTSTQKTTSELVILLTPRISETPLQMEDLGYQEVIKKK
ncbi:MAG TPA: secretin N-terminal domain-containing protein [Thermodesulfobacteriota bacterium]|nr:secretin N-terminal domain-containing protein [Thermodesulfobacteriota bacterium]